MKLSARNQLLPVLNLNALYQLNGLGHSLDQSEAVISTLPSRSESVRVPCERQKAQAHERSGMSSGARDS